MSPIDRAAHLNHWRSRSLTEKAVLALGMLLLATLLPPYPVAGVVAAVMTAAALLGARVPVRVWLACAVGPMGFLLAGVVSLVVQVDTSGLGLAPGGLAAAAGLAARSLAGFTCLLFLALTTPATDLMAGLRRLGLPAEITEVALLMYRFLFLLTETAMTMDAAQAARLGHVGARRRLSSLGVLIANLLPARPRPGTAAGGWAGGAGWEGEMRVLTRRPTVSMPGLALVLAVEAGTAALGVWMS